MSDEEAFLAAIKAAPDDEAPRKVFADWLDERGRDDEAAYQQTWTVKTASMHWLRAYANRMNHYEPPDEAFHTLIEGLRSGHLFAHGSDLHGFDELDDPEELKRHAEIFLGIEIDWQSGQFTFSCSC